MDRKSINVAFMGTPDFAKASLEALINAGYNVKLVVTKVDKPVGRGMKIKYSEVKQYAIEKNIEICQPEKVKNNQEFFDKLKELDLDFIAVVAYGKILPKEVLDIPKYGCINVHGSLLPKYRGSAPIQWSIINGDSVTGVTTMFMDEGMDTGDMLLKANTSISQEDNLESVYNRLKDIGGKLLVETLDGVIDNTIKREKQSNEFTTAPMISKEMTKIDFNKTAVQVCNLIRGLNPFPSTHAIYEDGSMFKIGSVTVVENENNLDYKPGQIVKITKNEIIVKCSDGSISINTIKPEGKKMMDIVSFINGNKIIKEGEFFK